MSNFTGAFGLGLEISSWTLCVVLAVEFAIYLLTPKNFIECLMWHEEAVVRRNFANKAPKGGGGAFIFQFEVPS